MIHFPEGGYARSSGGVEHYQPSLKLPAKFIAGTVGAGDAFCAGVLYGLHEGWPIERTMLLAVSAAASSLSHVTCSEGIKELNQVLTLANEFGFSSTA